MDNCKVGAVEGKTVANESKTLDILKGGKFRKKFVPQNVYFQILSTATNRTAVKY